MTCLTLLARFACILLIGRLPTSWHLRMTIILTTPQDQNSGAALTKISTRFHNGVLRLQQTAGVRSSLHGKTVGLEVATRRFLFVPLDGAKAWTCRYFFLADQTACDPLTQVDRIARLRRIPRDGPAILAQSFGQAVSLTSVTLEMTSDAVISGLV